MGIPPCLPPPGFPCNPHGWLDVDPLHPPSGEVIVALPSGWVTAADYAAGRWWRNGEELSSRPTHYQPMPTHPTVGEKHGS